MSSFLRENRPKVIVIGGGAAGIGAARTLYQAGWKPIVLEGRDRIGGRVHSHQMFPNLGNNNQNHIPNDTFVTVQLGANWIHGLNEDINPMYTVALKNGLRLHQTSSDDEPGDDVLLYDFIKGGKAENIESTCIKGQSDLLCLSNRVSKEDYTSVLERYEWIRDNFESYAVVTGKNDFKISHDEITVQSAFDLCIQASEHVFGSLSELHRRCFNWILDRVAIDMGKPLQDVHKINYSEGDSSGLFGEAIVIDGGYFSILDGLAREFPLNIHFNSAVNRIEYRTGSSARNNNAVTVYCDNGAIYDGDICIITASLGVLHSQLIDFVPAIPRCIKTIDCRLEMGLMNLVWLWFPFDFWPKNYNFFGVTRGSNFEHHSTFTTFLAPTVLDNHGKPQPILMCQVIGDFAVQLETMQEEDIANAAMKVLRSMFAKDCGFIPDPIACKHSSWKSDKFAGGSWSHYAFRATQPFFVEEDDQEEPLYYAGEAASTEFRGTVHGAYLSGTAAATHIIEKFAN